uniref:anthrax toxin-like adenylyl cyclase domain-containing protein n=1 Tax=Bacillus cereus group sp. BfR-BA-01524 TaxID=2920372 RepID=UPI001F591695
MKKCLLKTTLPAFAIATLIGLAPINAASAIEYGSGIAYNDSEEENFKEMIKKEHYDEWKRSLTLIEADSLKAFNHSDINRLIRESDGNIDLIKDGININAGEIRDTIQNIDKALIKSKKVEKDIHVFKYLTDKDLDFRIGNLYNKDMTSINRDKYHLISKDFKYGMFSGYLDPHLIKQESVSKGPILLELKIPKGTHVGYLDNDGHILLPRNQGINITKSHIIVENGKERLKFEAKIVDKKTVVDEIKDKENTINKVFREAIEKGTSIHRENETPIENKLVNIISNSLNASVIVNRAERLLHVLAQNIPSDLLIKTLEQMKHNAPITITDSNWDTVENELNIKMKDRPQNAAVYYNSSTRQLILNLSHMEQQINQEPEFPYDGLVSETDRKILLRQIGLAINDLLIKDTVLSETEEFKSIYDEEKDHLNDLSNFTNTSKFFADIFEKMYSSNQNERLDLEQKVPKSVGYIKGKIKFATSDKIDLDGINVDEGNVAVEGSGLVPEHIEKFKNVAKERNTFIFVRPVNKLATSLIKKGAATKGMNVHGKSSDWGPAAGYIPFDQDLSKKHGNKEVVEKGNTDNEESLQEHMNEISTVKLKLDNNRIEELKKEGLISIGEKETDNGKDYNALKTENSIYDFRIDILSQKVQYKTKDGIHTILGEEFGWKDLEVMAKIVNRDHKPLTADYDLFALSPKLTEIKKYIPTQEWEQAVINQKPLDKLKKITKLLIKYGFKREAFPGKGQMPNWQVDFIDALNIAAREAGYEGGTVVNH